MTPGNPARFVANLSTSNISSDHVLYSFSGTYPGYLEISFLCPINDIPSLRRITNDKQGNNIQDPSFYLRRRVYKLSG